MKGRYNTIICVMLAAASVLFEGCGIFPEEEVFETATLVSEYEKKEFSTVTVQRGDVCDYKRIACIYKESNTQEIVLGAWDFVSEVYVNVGDTVKKGDVLLSFGGGELDDNIEDYKYQISINETLIKHAVKDKKLEIEKQKAVLNDKTSIKAIEERYDAQIGGYKSDLEILNMRLDKAEEEKESLQIRSEMDGKVTFLNIGLLDYKSRFDNWEEQGDREKDMNYKLMTISDGSQPRFTGSVNSEDIRLEDGQVIDVICDNNTYNTTVRYGDNGAVNFMLDAMPEGVKDGAPAFARYVLDERKDVLYLPDSAVTSMGDDTIVYVDDGNGFKKPVMVEAGLSANNRTEIISGLQEGDLVIVR